MLSFDSLRQVPGGMEMERPSMVMVMVGVMGARNPKAEARRPKEGRNPKAEGRNSTGRVALSFSPYGAEDEVQFLGFAPDYSRLSGQTLFRCGHHAEEEHALL